VTSGSKRPATADPSIAAGRARGDSGFPSCTRSYARPTCLDHTAEVYQLATNAKGPAPPDIRVRASPLDITRLMHPGAIMLAAGAQLVKAAATVSSGGASIRAVRSHRRNPRVRCGWRARFC